jgi:ferric-dicitrate binding protein FerR (iron transport regulator)
MRCRKAKELISLYLAPHTGGLSPRSCQALEAHLAACEPCRREYREDEEAITLLRRYWQVSADTRALLQRSRPQGQDQSVGKTIGLRWSLSRATAWTMATAACLVIGVFGWRAMSTGGAPGAEPGNRAASSGMALVIEAAGDGARIAPGAILQTSTEEVKSLLLNGKHQVVMNAGTRLSIEPFTDKGSRGCMVNLARGEVYVHVVHDGFPFLVQTAHGRAVITGTTFDVRATEAGTTLAVVEGSVRFESTGGSVQVLAGQQSTIAGTLAPPTTPCPGVALTTWARSADPGKQIAQDLRTQNFPEDLPTMPPLWAKVRTDLDRIDYTQWIEQKRAWFKEQFPWIFDLKDALESEGVEVDYPALLMQSGDIWRFGYPPAGSGRQVEPDPNGLLQAVSYYGRDESWLQQQALPSLRALGRGPQTTASETFERWARTIQAQADLCPPKVVSGVFLDTVNACLYLANTRTLAIWVIRAGLVATASEVKEEVLGLLQEELRTLARCVELSQGLDLAQPKNGTCEGLDRLHVLVNEVRSIGQLEKRVAEYERLLSP